MFETTRNLPIDLSRVEAFMSGPPSMETYMPRGPGLRAVVVAFGLGALYVFGLVFYRLFLSPLAKFPGSKLAAVTGWYELYYDVIKKGKYLFEIEKMHDKYGMCICSLLNLTTITEHNQCRADRKNQPARAVYS